MLARVFLTPGEQSIADIARATSVSEATVLREVDRLIETGFVTERRQGRSRLIRPDRTNPATSPLTALLAVTVGPAHLLRERLAEVRGLDFAAIYRSWAARATGVVGDLPADIDVLVVGDVSRTEVYEIAEDASGSLGREVNVAVIARDRWIAGTDPFVATVQQRALVTLVDRLDVVDE